VAPAANAAGWWSAPPTVLFACSDAESGIASCPAPISVTTEGAGQVVSGTATDRAGNSAGASVTINLDLTDPSVSCPPVPSFLLRETGATLTATVTDALSGPAAPTVSVAVSTGAVGLHSATVTGSDVAGRPTSVGCPYRTVYQVQAFAAPIDNPPTINTAKAGKTIPVAWRLTDATGAPVAEAGSFVSVTSGGTSCSSSDPTDDVEAYSGNSGLQYLGDGWWQFNWKTPSSFAGQCRVLRLNLSSGQDGPTAYFRFR